MLVPLAVGSLGHLPRSYRALARRRAPQCPADRCRRGHLPNTPTHRAAALLEQPRREKWQNTDLRCHLPTRLACLLRQAGLRDANSARDDWTPTHHLRSKPGWTRDPAIARRYDTRSLLRARWPPARSDRDGALSVPRRDRRRRCRARAR